MKVSKKVLVLIASAMLLTFLVGCSGIPNFPVIDPVDVVNTIPG
jgi:hypothetical protein